MNEVNYNSKSYQGKYTGYVLHTVDRPSEKKDCELCDGCGQVEVIDNGRSQVRVCGKCSGSGEGKLFVYAFIDPDDKTIGDVFAHHREIEPGRPGFKALTKGDFVEFELVESDRGPSARNIIIKERKGFKRRIIRDGVVDV